MFTLIFTWPLGVVKVSLIGLFSYSVVIDLSLSDKAQLCLNLKSSKRMFSGSRMLS